jgi:hypothetical protein
MTTESLSASIALLTLVSWTACTAEDWPPAIATNDLLMRDRFEIELAILEVYYGLDQLPAAASLICGLPVAGLDGVPVTFSRQLDDTSLQLEDFVVRTDDGRPVTPDCATLRPANEALELRTILLVGSFGTPAAQPKAVEVVGTLRDLALAAESSARWRAMR